MLGSKTKPKKSESSTFTTAAKDGNCIISPGTRIEGKFNSSENIRMDGTVIGELKCEKKLVMGKGSRVEGKIFSNEAVIMGDIEGDLTVDGVLHLHNTAKIRGNIIAKKMIVDEGAIYNGECKIGG